MASPSLSVSPLMCVAASEAAIARGITLPASEAEGILVAALNANPGLIAGLIDDKLIQVFKSIVTLSTAIREEAANCPGVTDLLNAKIASLHCAAAIVSSEMDRETVRLEGDEKLKALLEMERFLVRDLTAMLKELHEAPTMAAGYEILAEFTEYRGHGVPVALRSPSERAGQVTYRAELYSVNEPAEPNTYHIVEYVDGKPDSAFGVATTDKVFAEAAAGWLQTATRGRALQPKEPTHG